MAGAEPGSWESGCQETPPPTRHSMPPSFAPPIPILHQHLSSWPPAAVLLSLLGGVGRGSA